MFIILARQGSGTHLLATLLNSHPSLRCYDEVLKKNRPKSVRNLMLREKNILDMDENEGSIVMYNHLVQASEKAIERIRKNKIIHLTRNIEDNKKRIRAARERALKKLSGGMNMYEITYEYLTNGKHNIREFSEEMAKPMLEFLGVKPMKLTTFLVRPNYVQE